MTINFKSSFGCHSVPFTREIRVDELHDMPFIFEARDNIVRAIEKRMSAAIICGPGTGKSTVVRAVIGRLSEARYCAHYVKCTDIGKRDMCREIAFVCGVPSAGFFPTLLRRIQDKFESSLADSGRRPVLFLDEAHDLRPEVLSMLRVLTNFQMDSKLVLSIVLAGQPPLATLLSHDDQSHRARACLPVLPSSHTPLQPGGGEHAPPPPHAVCDQATGGAPCVKLSHNPCHRVCDCSCLGACNATPAPSRKLNICPFRDV